MISTTKPKLFKLSLTQLQAHKKQVGNSLKGRFTQIFLALKYYQNELPSMHSGQFISTEVLQILLDDLFSKSSKNTNECLLMLFEGSFLARTGLKAPGNLSPQNTWRNNLNIQKGIGCYATPAFLNSTVFLDEERVKCRFLTPVTPGKLAHAKCSLCPAGEYRSEQHRKWLRIDPAGNGYAVTDLLNTSNFSPYVAPQGQRIPILPLLIAIYYDADPGLKIGARPTVDISDFLSDFNFSATEFNAYFDDDPKNKFNAALLKADPGSSYNRAANAILPQSIPNAPKSAKAGKLSPKKPKSLPSMALYPVGTVVPPPAINTGWGAQQCALAALTSAGWSVNDVSRMKLGFDLLAKKGTRTLFVEVKSSLGLCGPSLTANEWSQAHHHENNYVLAIIENFNEAAINTVYWIRDPANTCTATPITTISHAISRSTWQKATVPLTAI